MIWRVLPLLGVALVGLVSLASYGESGRAPAFELPAIRAHGVDVDTVLIGGHTSGDFGEAVRVLTRSHPPTEQTLLAHHLEQIFGERPRAGAGRLRIAYERTRHPSGTVRAVRILAAELAAGGRVQTAYFYERDGRPAYFDHFGHSLERADWLDPLAGRGRPTSSFGSSRMHPVLQRTLPHTGLDLAAPAGLPVVAAADGVVVEAGERGGYGLLVEIQHPNGYSTRYAHLSGFAAGMQPGALARRGEVIGRVGRSGLATGNHLHFEVRRGGRPIDPALALLNPVPAADVIGGSRWYGARTALGSLLARAPTVLPQSVAAEGAGR